MYLRGELASGRAGLVGAVHAVAKVVVELLVGDSLLYQNVHVNET